MPEAGSRRPRRSHGFEPSRQEQFRGAIAREEARLARLETERAQAQTHLAALRSELAALGDIPESRESSAPQPAPRAPETPADKVRLFRSLFRGRTDVVAVRFVSKRTGQAGYAPACRNKFVRDELGLVSSERPTGEESRHGFLRPAIADLSAIQAPACDDSTP